MPGTQSFLDRHEWIRHGTCYGRGDPQTYFQEALSLLDEVNGSAVQTLFASNIGKEITVGEVRTTFDTAFGSGAGDRVRYLANETVLVGLSPRSPSVWSLSQGATISSLTLSRLLPLQIQDAPVE
jgi:ribonuclease I